MAKRTSKAARARARKDPQRTRINTAARVVIKCYGDGIKQRENNTPRFNDLAKGTNIQKPPTSNGLPWQNGRCYSPATLAKRRIK